MDTLDQIADTTATTNPSSESILKPRRADILSGSQSLSHPLPALSSAQNTLDEPSDHESYHTPGETEIEVEPEIEVEAGMSAPTIPDPVPDANPTDSNMEGEKHSGRRWREEDEELEGENCIICLQTVRDRTVLVNCGHDAFCFGCICTWSEQSRKCPLCSKPMGDYLLHDLETPPPYVRFFLSPLVSKPSSVHPQNPYLPPASITRRQPRRRDRASINPENEADDTERRVERRREIYRWGLYTKHVGSNVTTRYKPIPTPQQFALNTDMIGRATVFLRREFRVWTGVDVEFMVSYTISLMKSIDLRSDAAVRLLAEFLDVGEGEQRRNAEHFAHEVYSFIRSPFRELHLYDRAAQYDPVPSRRRLEQDDNDDGTSRSISRSLRSNHRDRSPSPKRRRSKSPVKQTIPGLEVDGGLGEAIGPSGTRVDVDSDEDEMMRLERALDEGEGEDVQMSQRRGRSVSRSSSFSDRSNSSLRSYRERSPSLERRSRGSVVGRYGPPDRKGKKIPKRWNEYDSWIAPGETARLRARRASRSPPLSDVAEHGPKRAALPDQGSVFSTRATRQPSHYRPPPHRTDLVASSSSILKIDDDSSRGGMRAWTAEAENVPSISISDDSTGAHLNPSLLSRMNTSAASKNNKPSPRGPSGGEGGGELRITGAASRGKAGLGGSRMAQLAIRGSSALVNTLSTEAGGAADRDTERTSKESRREGKSNSKSTVSRNVLLQRLQEAKADALQAQLKKAQQPSVPADADTGLVELNVSSVTTLLPLASSPHKSNQPSLSEQEAPTKVSLSESSGTERKKPDVGVLKKKILERLEAEKKMARSKTGVKESKD
ncbi:FOG: Predicted E3 ubiquitin ligase [Phaffia rhodozyma]|uniref:RING-type E3 ubiquitin transferase n=1 Tax=Phaffia rhodozyma TaxID=264483 RepID=A0A0F7SK72_PHARH|nr:FOG: Predicted E3 ubiquitin ligase [Phaffia rhodozyma]